MAPVPYRKNIVSTYRRSLVDTQANTTVIFVSSSRISRFRRAGKGEKRNGTTIQIQIQNIPAVNSISHIPRLPCIATLPKIPPFPPIRRLPNVKSLPNKPIIRRLDSDLSFLRRLLLLPRVSQSSHLHCRPWRANHLHIDRLQHRRPGTPQQSDSRPTDQNSFPAGNGQTIHCD